MNVPVRLLNSSPVRWIEVPLPLEAMLSWPGRVFAYAMNSATLLTGSEGWTTITFGTAATLVTGTKSLSGW